MNAYRTLLLGFALATGSAWPYPAYPINGTATVQWDSNMFPAGYQNMSGSVIPGPASGPYSVGIFGLEFNTSNDVPDAGYQDFRAICIDASEHLFAGGAPQLYYVQTLSSYPAAIVSGTGYGPTLDAAQRDELAKLFTVGWADAQPTPKNDVKSAAFQWAAWEIGRETSPTLDVSSGAVQYSNNDAVRDQANAYLSALQQSNVTASSVLIWSPVKWENNQYVRVAGQELLTLSPVPEPAHFGVLLAVGVAYLIWHKRRTLA